MNRLFFIFLFSLPSMAMVSLPHVECPDQAIIRIKEKVDLESVDHVHARQEIKFEVLSKLTGSVTEKTKIEILKFGLIEISQGEEYKIGLNQGRICSLEHLP